MTTSDPKLDLELLRTKARGSLYFFAKGILGYNWIVPHIHGPLCTKLEDKTSRRKLFVLPRGWLKTTLCTISFPMWLAINNPNVRILLVQNSATNAMKKLASIRGHWESNDLLRALFPELLPTRSSVWKADALCLTRNSSYPESTFEAAGTSTRVVSRHYDVIIEDDTVAPDYDELGQESLAPSHEDVEKAIGWHRTNVLPLMNNPQEDLSLVVGTRWYDQDLIRWIQDNEPQYQCYTRASRENSLGEPDYKGEITYPERFNESTLRELETAMGPYMFGCLYMNTPIRREDMAFKPEWFEYYETNPPLSSLAVYTTIDPATDPALSKVGNTDYSVVMTCGKDMVTGKIYVLDYFRQRCNPGELASAIFSHVVGYRPVLVGYEDVAYQRSIEYWLRELMRQQNVFFVLERLQLSNRADAKNLRIAGLQPLFASKSIFLRTHMKELVSELMKFPLGAHDDLADALSMQLGLWRMTRSFSQFKTPRYDDELTFEGAVESIRQRKKVKNTASVVTEPSRYERSLDNPLVFMGR